MVGILVSFWDDLFSGADLLKNGTVFPSRGWAWAKSWVFQEKPWQIWHVLDLFGRVEKAKRTIPDQIVVNGGNSDLEFLSVFLLGVPPRDLGCDSRVHFTVGDRHQYLTHTVTVGSSIFKKWNMSNALILWGSTCFTTSCEEAFGWV